MAVKVASELPVLVPFALVPCQYHAVPEGVDGGVPRVIMLCPHWSDTVGVDGAGGDRFTVTHAYIAPPHILFDGLNARNPMSLVPS